MAHNQKGFTIVELMIAVSVFSVLAMIATMVIVQLQRSYQLGATKAKLLDASRLVHSEFAQNIELGSQVSAGTSNATINGVDYTVWCAGTTRFSWLQSPDTNGDVVRDPSGGALYQDTVNGVGDCTSGTFSNPKSLLPTTGFVTKFDVTGGAGGIYSLDTRFAVGQRDMF